MCLCGRPAGLARCRRSRGTARRRGGRGPLTTRATRDRCGRSSAWHCARTGRSSGSACWPWSLVLGRRGRAGVLPLAARQGPQPGGPVHVLAGHDGGHPGRPPACGGHRRALRARARRGTQRGAGAVRHSGCHSGGHGGRRHGDLRFEPRHARLAPGALRLELELRHRRGRRPRRHPRPGGGQAARCGSTGAGLDRHLLLHPRTRRRERARHGHHARGQPSPLPS